MSSVIPQKARFVNRHFYLYNRNPAWFNCYMSKSKSPGYCQKRAWLEARFTEGIKLKIVVHELGGRNVAFIEYILDGRLLSYHQLFPRD